MTDQSLRRTDELLTELVDVVETARTLPMSSSIIMPRERVLDLLDDLRETMPPEMQEARRTIANRDTLLHEAFEQARQARETANAEAHELLSAARERADRMVGEAEGHAHAIIEAGRTEHDRLVAETGIHQAAAKAAAQLHTDAEQYLQAANVDAEARAQELRQQAQAYAAKLTADAEDYAERTLGELVETLQRSAATAEQGRVALARRRGEAAAQSATALAPNTVRAPEHDRDPAAQEGGDAEQEPDSSVPEPPISG